jgi:hypothetical protein
VTNTGDTHLSNIRIVDDRGTVGAGDDVIITSAQCPGLAGPLAPGGRVTCTANIMVTGDVTNIATATGNPTDSNGNDLPDINDVSDTDNAVVDMVNPGLEIIKTAGNAPDGAVEYLPGPPPQNVTYTYTVRNTGDTPLFLDRPGTNPTYGVTDNLCSPVAYVSGDTNNNGLLDLAEVWVFRCTSTINVSTPVTNTATAVGNPTDPNGNDLPDIPDATDTDTAVVDIVNPAVDIQKTVYLGHNAGASCPGVELVAGSPGAAITYCFRVTNTGDTYLRVNISDATLGIVNGAGLLPVGASPALPALLAPGGVATYYFQTTINGDLINTATVTGTPTDSGGTPLPDIPNVTDSDTAQVDEAVNTAAIGDYVWYDADKDGIQDAGEVGIGGVTLRLIRDTGNGTLGPEDTVVATTTTGVDGGYIFSGLPAGTYFVDVTDANGVLAGHTLSVGPQSSTDPTGPITISAGQFYEDADFGYYKPTGPTQAVIGDTVWYDFDADGIRDPGEPGIPGVTVIITDSLNNVYTGVTGPDGTYHIVVTAGDGRTYTVAPNPATLPPGLTATTPVPHLVPALPGNGSYLDADFGYDSPNLGAIGNQIWRDTTKDGIYDSNTEPGIPGVTVNLYRDDGDGIPEPNELFATMPTDSNGQYLFTGLPAGNYLVQVSDTAHVLENYVPTTIIGGVADNTNKAQPYAVTLAAGATNLTADFGYVLNDLVVDKGIIGNQVWFEMDGDGIYEPQNGEIGLEGVTVQIYRNGQLIGEMETGAFGLYAFTDLAAGTYTVTIASNATTAAVLGNLNVTTIIGGSADNTNKPRPYTVTLPTNTSVNMTADFGYTEPSNYLISKQLTIPGVEPVKRGSLITFTIRITNTGESWIATLPLTDTYDTRFLTFNGATPAPNSVLLVGNVGTLTWNDLTGAGQLPPGGVVTVLVRFIASGDTTDPATNPTAPVTINYARVPNPIFDADGPTGPLPPLAASTPKQAQDDVRILDPTSVLISDAKLDSQSSQVTVMWKTATESDVLGFNVLRTVNGVTTRLNAAMIEATFSGQASSGSYSFVDDTVEVGQLYFYFIEIVMTNGTVQEHSVGSTLVAGANRLFLPLVTRK